MANPISWLTAGCVALCVTALTGCSDRHDIADPNDRTGGSADSMAGAPPVDDPSGEPPGGMADTPRFEATLRTTTFGIPHVQADDFAGLGYGLGYAQARDNLCVLAEEYLTIRGERAAFFGRDGEYEIPAAGASASNVDSDFFWRLTITPERLEAFEAGAGPQAIDASRGFAAGYNRYLRELRAGEHPGRHLACRDAEWVGEIGLEDMLRRYVRLAVLASASALPTEIATAAPPGADRPPADRPSIRELLERLSPEDMPMGEPDIGSNVYALGHQATRNGQSILFGNPHFPWTGTERLYQMQLTIPGEANVAGASLYGVPAPLIGFNEHFAWSHTVSTAYRFTFYRLQLDPQDPTRYRFDGEFRDLEPVPLTIEVREDDGSVSELERTLYRSRYGPMLELSVSGIPVLDWNRRVAYTLRDANIENDRLIRQYFEWNLARSFDEFKRLHGEILGVPWVNTGATGPGQAAYYGDVSVVPNVPDSMAQRECATPLSSVFAVLMPGLPVLDGSRSECDWRSDPDAPVPGIFGPANLPTLERDDYVANMNDSYWLTHPEEPLTGFAAIIGDEATERTLRTRLGLKLVERRLAGSDGRGATGFDTANLKDIVLASDIYSAELARQALLEGPCARALQADLQQACTVLANWDGKANLDSVGNHVWREFWLRVNERALPVGGPTRPALWRTPFAVDDPVDTPRGFRAGGLRVAPALRAAVRDIEAAGIPLDAPMRDIQYSSLHPASGAGRIPIFGDLGDATGSFTVAGDEPLDDTGYPVDRGNSYLQIVTWTPGCSDEGDGCTPIADTFVTYTQTTDPASPHYRDQTEAYSAKQWHRVPFTEAQIAADPNLVVEELAE